MPQWQIEFFPGAADDIEIGQGGFHHDNVGAFFHV